MRFRDERLCKNCKFQKFDGAFFVCDLRYLTNDRDYKFDCQFARKTDWMCGEKAKHFKSKILRYYPNIEFRNAVKMFCLINK
jgi:hypothetical protein